MENEDAWLAFREDVSARIEEDKPRTVKPTEKSNREGAHARLCFLSFYLLQRGMRFAVPAALVCGLILAVCYAVCRRQGRRFPWGKAVCVLLLVGWAAVTFFVTLLRSEPNEFAARQWNLQLFLAWREAYQRFTLQIWLNVLLNIALFVPLGVLLPLLWKPFRKWYAALGAGFGVSLLIELTQLFTGRGMCDVDDLFTNTLGAMLGWCAAMFVLALRQRAERGRATARCPPRSRSRYPLFLSPTPRSPTATCATPPSRRRT